MKKSLYTSLATIATLVATMVATSACFLWMYQPIEPKSLRDE